MSNTDWGYTLDLININLPTFLSLIIQLFHPAYRRQSIANTELVLNNNEYNNKAENLL